MSLFAASEAFFAKHIGGRAQKELTPELQKRLAEISVDPKTVVLAPKLDAGAVGAPQPAVELQPGSSSYEATMSRGDQTMKMSVTREIKQDGGSWVITESAKTPMGEAVDTTTLQKGTLVVQKRSIRQGPVSVELAVENGKATGTMGMGGQSKPIAADLGGPLFADGAGAPNVLAALPLAEGYETKFRNFDIQRQKVGLKQLKVAGVEEVQVAAGKFKAWKVEVSSAEGEPGTITLWIDTASRKVVKTSATLPQMGGATVVSELQP
jgi:hypothetical protein